MNPSAKHAVISLLLLVANAPMSLSTSSDSQSSNPPVAPDPDFLGSPLFSAWTDPASGVISHLLAPSGTEAGRARIAPLQQTFYYINNGLFSAPGGSRLLWFYCAFPPAQVRTLAVADFDAGTMRKFPDAGLGGAGTNPAMLHPVTGEVCWSNTQGIWRRSPSPGTRPVLVNAFDPKFINNRSLIQYATHLTLSADGGAFAIDARIGG
ncbi:MAG: hypothetical protein LBC18_04095, partial [Opitutaceae bacterium]|nr:hypothetical protein [Opitutaceae bacterium]